MSPTGPWPVKQQFDDLKRFRLGQARSVSIMANANMPQMYIPCQGIFYERN